LKALSHPLRQRILRALDEQTSSPSKLAEELGEPLGNISYHVKILAEYGTIELVETTPVRGALEHHYRATVRVDLLPIEVDERGYREVVALIGETFDRAAEISAAARRRLDRLERSERRSHRTELGLLRFERSPKRSSSE
jgi:DNA-binding transcriptional ArsR family regulator